MGFVEMWVYGDSVSYDGKGYFCADAIICNIHNSLLVSQILL